jgi:hypothetical protein
MVSGNRPEKNIYRAVKSFDGLFSKGYLKDYRVVITGCSNICPSTGDLVIPH